MWMAHFVAEGFIGMFCVMGLEVLRRRIRPWLQVSNRFKNARPGHGEVRSGREAGGDQTSGPGCRQQRVSQESGDHLLGLIGKGLLGTGEVGVPGAGVPQLDPRSGTDDGAVPGKPGILSQV